ncbi:MAG: ribonuclease H-like domain-containing protein [Candidatus Acidiferrales bacterium]
MTTNIIDRFARLTALKPPKNASPATRASAEPTRGFAPALPEGAERLARLLQAAACTNNFGEHLTVRKWFSEPIGCAPPDGAVQESALRLLAPNASQEVANPSQWLLLDTETTGLMGGTGTYPFLVGIAWWDAGGLQVEQFFMRELSEEHALLVTLAERMAERPVLVTFNGKSFDWPLLETRYRMTRKIKPSAPRAHLDFLHPARNLWRIRLGSVRLAELEKHVLGWHRGADLISEMIPQFYFDYLRGGPPEPLVQVFLHNQMDLRGLAGLASRIVATLAEPQTRGATDGLELFGVSRICERRGDTLRAKKHYAQSLAAALPAETDRAARRSLARLAKRDGDLPLACELWESILGNSREGFEAYEQLAVYYEHEACQPQRAAALARAALSELQRARRHASLSAALQRRYKTQFEHRLKRLDRLEQKTVRPLLEPTEPESPARPRESNHQGRKGSLHA